MQRSVKKTTPMKLKRTENEPRSGVYARTPIRFHGDIPVFSESDEYIENYEKIASDHLSFLKGDSAISFPPEYFVRQTESSTAALVRKYSEPGMKILDVGVSRGCLLSYFDDLDRYGLDISLGYLEIARARGIEVCYSRIEDMPYKKEIFDVVACTDVLEHVLDLNLCCRQLLSVLKPTGVLIIRVPYLEDLSPYLSPGFPYKYVHMRTFDIPSVQMLFEKILNCRVREMVLAGYFADERRRKQRVPFPNVDYVLARLNAVPEQDRPTIYESVLANWYEAATINAVIVRAEAALTPLVGWADISRTPAVTESKPNDQATRSALERQLVAEFNHNADLTNQLAAAGQALESTEARLKEERASLQEARDALRDNGTLLAAAQHVQQDVESQLAATQRSYEESQARLQEERSGLRSVQNILRDTEAGLALTQRSYEESQARLQEEQSALRSVQNILRDTEAELALTQQRLEESQSRVLNVESTLRDAQERLAETHARLEDVEKRLRMRFATRVAGAILRRWRAWRSVE
jgi:SAM-dependent methyltransferase